MPPFSDISLKSSIFTFLFSALTYLLTLIIYRLYFRSLSKFPGPKLWAISFWPEFYRDVIRRGRFTWEIWAMHKKYGPIIRINPNELHIDDPDYYDTVYPGPSKQTEKYPPAAARFGNSLSVFGTVAHNHHRIRRSAIAGYFSKQAVSRFSSEIQTIVDHLCERLKGVAESQQPINLKYAFSALTVDVITEYSFSKPYDALSQEDFAPSLYGMIMGPSEASHFLVQFPWLYPVLDAMPLWFVRMTNKPIADLIDLQKRYAVQVYAIMDGTAKYHESSSHPTTFHEMLANEEMGPEEKTIRRLVDEAQTIVGAGTLTTANVLKTCTYHVLANPPILSRLKEELETAIPDPHTSLPLSKLEQLPYLNAIIAESLRKSYGVSSRLQRIAPDRALHYSSYTIPPGTCVGMTSVLTHENAGNFPKPDSFLPERWIKDDGSFDHKLEKYIMPFSRGSRTCLGMNLAYAEMYLTLAAIFRKFEMMLYETDRSDVEVVHDFFNPSPKMDSKGVRVVVERSLY